MEKRRFLPASARLIAGASFLALMVGACNKQPTATEAPMVAPPMAALPLAGGAPPPQSPAPVGAALAAPPTPIRYAPLRGSEGYGYIDQAYSMGQAFADTPPDYAVDYQGTRPWVWRSGDGAYRIVERLPQGERFFYYRAGQDYPFLVRDPDYSYAYDNGDLVAVYGADGAELNGAFAARRADEASRYLYRARELYRAAQYQQRTSAYANEWGDRQDQLRRENQVWQQQQDQNAGWRAWHEAHQSQEQQWLAERNHRLAYAAAIGLAAASRGAAPDPAQISRRQAAYFSNWNASHGHAPTSQQAAASNTTTAPPPRTAPPLAATKGGTVLNAQSAAPQPVRAQRVEVASAQSKGAAAAQVQKQAAEARQRNTATAQTSSAQAAHEQQVAAQAQLREAAAARAKAAQDAQAQRLAAQAQRLAAQAKQHEAAAAQAKAAEAARQQRAESLAKQHEQSAAAAKAAEAARQQKSEADAKQRQAAAAQVKAAQAARAERLASQAKQREAAAAQAQAARAAGAEKSAADAKQREAVAAARAARAEKSAADAKQREAAAAQAKAAQETRAKQTAPQAQRENHPAPPTGKKPDHSKRKPPKDQGDQPQ